MNSESEGLLFNTGGIIAKAVDFAAMKHEGKPRKNPEARIPYIVHPFRVAMMLRDADFDEEVVAAGLLHDTVEDSDATIKELTEEFGERVAGLVKTVTEPGKDMSWKERQEAYLKNIEMAGEEALALSACDKIDNMRSMLQSLDAGYDVFKSLNAPAEDQLAKFERLLGVYKGKVPQSIEGLFEQTLRRLASVAANFC